MQPGSAQYQVIFDTGPLAGGTAFSAPRFIIRADAPAEVPAAFAAMEQAKADGFWLAGYASYELGYVFSHKLADLIPADRTMPLLHFGVFDGPVASHPQDPSAPATLTAPEAVWDQAAYDAAFGPLKEYIAAGDIYQANLTFPLVARYSGAPLALYQKLRDKQPVPYGAFVDLGGPVLLSRSPELFFEVDGTGKIETKPMKGTVARGQTDAQDAANIEWLKTSEKNQAENLMIVDLMRNDISRLAEVGSVKVPDLFTIETYATLHQMTSRIVAQLLPAVTVQGIFAALFPCGSITGAPKIRAMQIIRSLESQARDAYCGSIGWIAPDGTMQFNVAIRTLACQADGTVRLNVGGGIVHDSMAQDEYAEAIIKARYANLTD
ncbi:aminodeoxychorismate synthase component I [Pseudorhodobacter ferrugineus]|uniref:aminodeoxychorismate synthase component I n=1 Tax=Pseudorhodobacter ferrugineus TaxID=77008 RepID=UPI0003B31FC2|nr:aminodeoxychorismate synthase component I [Pseudorhodobacter ferrugineus]